MAEASRAFSKKLYYLHLATTADPIALIVKAASGNSTEKIMVSLNTNSGIALLSYLSDTDKNGFVCSNMALKTIWRKILVGIYARHGIVVNHLGETNYLLKRMHEAKNLIDGETKKDLEEVIEGLKRIRIDELKSHSLIRNTP